MNHSILLLNLMFFHFVADFVCQSRWMATNKSKSFLALFFHVLTYATVITFMIWCQEVSPFFDRKTIIDPINYVWFFIANFALHFVIDAITSRISGYFYSKDNMKAFWNTIGFDQYLHFICLWVSSLIWLSN